MTIRGWNDARSAALAVATALAVSACATPNTVHELTGSITLRYPGYSGTTTNSADLGQDCQGTGGYSDIREGARVVVRDGNGTTLATTSLLVGTVESGGYCRLDLEPVDLPESDFYRISAGNDSRGTLEYAMAELEGLNWTVDLSLG